MMCPVRLQNFDRSKQLGSDATRWGLCRGYAAAAHSLSSCLLILCVLIMNL